MYRFVDLNRRLSAGAWVFASLMLGILAIATPASGGLIVTVGTHQLAANTANQQISLFVSGDALTPNLNVNGVVFSAQIEDGQTSTFAPTISGVDFSNGTIFAPSDPFVDQDLASNGRLEIWNVVTGDMITDVEANGKFVTLSIDTTGLFSGTFSLKLAGTLNGDTEFAVQSGSTIPQISNGFLTISSVPEPSSLLLLASLMGIAVQLRIRKNSRGIT